MSSGLKQLVGRVSGESVNIGLPWAVRRFEKMHRRISSYLDELHVNPLNPELDGDKTIKLVLPSAIQGMFTRVKMNPCTIALGQKIETEFSGNENLLSRIRKTSSLLLAGLTAPDVNLEQLKLLELYYRILFLTDDAIPDSKLDPSEKIKKISYLAAKYLEIICASPSFRLPRAAMQIYLSSIVHNSLEEHVGYEFTSSRGLQSSNGKVKAFLKNSDGSTTYLVDSEYETDKKMQYFVSLLQQQLSLVDGFVNSDEDNVDHRRIYILDFFREVMNHVRSLFHETTDKSTQQEDKELQLERYWVGRDLTGAVRPSFRLVWYFNCSNKADYGYSLGKLNLSGDLLETEETYHSNKSANNFRESRELIQAENQAIRAVCGINDATSADKERKEEGGRGFGFNAPGIAVSHHESSLEAYTSVLKMAGTRFVLAEGLVKKFEGHVAQYGECMLNWCNGYTLYELMSAGIGQEFSRHYTPEQEKYVNGLYLAILVQPLMRGNLARKKLKELKPDSTLD